MTELRMDELTPAQRDVLGLIACNDDLGHPRETVEALERRGLIVPHEEELHESWPPPASYVAIETDEVTGKDGWLGADRAVVVREAPRRSRGPAELLRHDSAVVLESAPRDYDGPAGRPKGTYELVGPKSERQPGTHGGAPLVGAAWRSSWRSSTARASCGITRTGGWRRSSAATS